MSFDPLRGPLGPLLGIWEGDRGTDLAPSDNAEDNREIATSNYRERFVFEPTGLGALTVASARDEPLTEPNATPAARHSEGGMPSTTTAARSSLTEVPQAAPPGSRIARANQAYPLSFPQPLGQPLHRARVQTACPRLAEAERLRDVVEAFAFEVVATDERGFFFG